jgi:hypothetical protein
VPNGNNKYSSDMKKEIDNILEGFHLNEYDLLEVRKKLLNLFSVSQQRELLLAFLEFYHNPKYNTVNTTFSEDVDMFLANNCG